MKLHKAILALLLLALVGNLVGCKRLRYREMHYGKYNEKTDTFSFLMVFTHFEAADREALQDIAKTWELRNQLLYGFGQEFFTTRRVSRNSIAAGLSETASDSLVPLDEITITPGDLFRGPDRTLCYSHRIDFPGSIVDRWLVASQPGICAGIKGQVAGELKRRREGGAVESWDSLRSAIQAIGQAPKKDEKDQNNPPAVLPPAPSVEKCLSAESLTKLAELAAGGKIDVRRNGKAFSLTLPLTEEDARQVAELAIQIRESLKKNNLNEGSILALLSSSVPVPGDLEIGARGERLLLLLQLTLPFETPLAADVPRTTEEQRKQAATYSAFTEKYKIPVQQHIEVNKLITHFRSEDYRSWVSADGAFRVDAIFVSKDDTQVKLKYRSGETKPIPISRLSAEDQRYVESR